MKLIDKDALVAEIEKLKDKAHNGVSYHQSRQNIGLENELSTWEHLENAFATVLKIINTLEVKEVDLEKEIKEHIDDEWSDEWSEDVDNWIRWRRGTSSMTIEDVKDIAKHFFELGLKAQKGE